MRGCGPTTRVEQSPGSDSARTGGPRPDRRRWTRPAASTLHAESVLGRVESGTGLIDPVDVGPSLEDSPIHGRDLAADARVVEHAGRLACVGAGQRLLGKFDRSGRATGEPAVLAQLRRSRQADIEGGQIVPAAALRPPQVLSRRLDAALAARDPRRGVLALLGEIGDVVAQPVELLAVT